MILKNYQIPNFRSFQISETDRLWRIERVGGKFKLFRNLFAHRIYMYAYGYCRVITIGNTKLSFK